MAIQHITTFEEFRGNGGSGYADTAFMPGWSDTGTSTSSLYIIGGSETTNANSPSPTNNGLNSGATTGYSSVSFAEYKTIQKALVDNTKVVVAAGCRICRSVMLKQTAILSIGGANKLSFGLNGKFAALYVNDVLAATSGMNVVDGNPWFFVELFQNKTTNRVHLRINGVNAADVELPAGHTSNAVIVDFGRNVSGYPVTFAEIMVYDTVDPLGPLFTHEFFKTGTVVKQFTGSDSIPNNRPYRLDVYKSSETLGAEDRWSYNNILTNTKAESTSIVAVIQKAIAASGGVSGGSLNLRLRLGSTNFDTSVSSALVSTTPVLVQKVWETNPATSVPWTRSDVQAMQTGYVVAT